jgi:hypothetical protein
MSRKPGKGAGVDTLLATEIKRTAEQSEEN